MKNIYFLLMLFIVCESALQAGEIQNDAEQFIKDASGEQIALRFSKYKIEPALRLSIEKRVKQKFFGSYVYLWEVSRNDTLRYLALLDNVYGKSLPITFICLFGMDGVLIKITVLRYREPYGGAVTGQRWLDQFIGVTPQDELTVGKQIDAITGATISSHSLTMGIKKLTLLAGQLLKSYPQNIIRNNITSEEKSDGKK